MRKLLIVVGTSFMLFMLLHVHAYAAGLDEITGNMLLETSVPTEMYESASGGAEVVASLEAGTVVFTMDKAENNWCRVSAGEYTGYIKVEYLKTIGDQDRISDELQQDMDYDHMRYDEVIQQQEQKTRAGRIGKVTLGLIGAVFVVGIVFTLIQTKGKTQKETPKN